MSPPKPKRLRPTARTKEVSRTTAAEGIDEPIPTEDGAHRRLEQLYEISQLFASFDNVQQTLDPVLSIATRTLPLHSAILVQLADGQSTMTIWSFDGQDSTPIRVAKEHAEAAYACLVEATATVSVERRAQLDMTAPPQARSGEDPAKTFIVMPLLVAQGSPIGALQLEAVRPLDKADVMFVNAIANQLAITLDRGRAWRLDVSGRERAEKGRTQAEARGITSERGRTIAEGLQAKSEALAGENARLYEEAQKAVRVREQILAVVSHDLKNPLAAILLTAGNLEKKGTAGEDGALLQSAGIIQRSAKRMVRLIDDLLDFASIEAGHLAIKRVPEDPGSMISETFAHFEAVARAKQLQLTVNVEAHLPKAYCDRDRLLQVLSNLVGNATKATAEGGNIKLGAEARGREVLFAVSDDGPGISKDDVQHLFERYWRSDEVAYNGTGLGLAIARGIVAAHGGRIWVESVLGRGATFLFTVPAADVPSEAGSRSQIHDSRPPRLPS